MVKTPRTTTATRKKTVYDLVGETRSPLRRGLDPLDDLLLDEEQELSREVKRIRLEQIVVRRRQEIERLKQGGDLDMGSMPSNADFMKMARLMSDLGPEEQKKVANAYAVLKMADRGQMGGSLGVLGQLMGYVRQNPGASENQMISYLKLMDGQLVKGIELAKAVNPQQSEDSTMKFMTIMKDLVIEGVRNPVLQALEKAQPQPGVFEQIFLRPELFAQFKEMGLFGGGKGVTSHLDIELEKIRGERHLQATKWELEMRRDELKRQAEDRRTESLLALLGPLSAIVAGPVAQRMQQLGEQQGAIHVPPVSMHHSPPQGGTTILLKCTCGYEGPTTFPGAAPNLIPCPGCDQELQVGGIAPGRETNV